MPKVSSMSGQSSSRASGLKSMPTETKKSTAKASRRGRASAAARALKSDCPTTMPARKAPSAMEASKSRAAPTAMPSASASTARVKRSRVPVRATQPSSRGMSFWPASSMKAVSPASLSTVRPSVLKSGPASGERKVGSSTSSRMVKRSSTTSQPSATCPARVCSRPLSPMTRVSTTVLATEMDMPNTRPAVKLPPSRQKAAAPASVATAIWMSAPLTAICRTASRSLR